MQSWPLRLISESTDMVNLRDLVSRQTSDAVDTSNNEDDADSNDQDFLDAASPDNRSEVSQWYDAHSEGKQQPSTPFMPTQSFMPSSKIVLSLQLLEAAPHRK